MVVLVHGQSYITASPFKSQPIPVNNKTYLSLNPSGPFAVRSLTGSKKSFRRSRCGHWSCGTRDTIVPQAWAEEVARLLPQGELILIPGGPPLRQLQHTAPIY